MPLLTLDSRPQLVRLAIQAFLPLSILVLAGYAIFNALERRSELEAQVAAQLESQLQDWMLAWEDRTLDQLNQWLALASEDPRAAPALEQRLRSTEPWFDSLYLWQPQREVTIRGRREALPAEFIHPLPPMTEAALEVPFANCIERARRLTRPAEVEPVRVAQAYVSGCRNERLPVRMMAASEAATLLSGAGMHEVALQAIEGAGVDPRMGLREGIAQGLDPFRLVVLRLQRAELLLHLGQEDRGLDQLYELGLEITQLNAPEAADVLTPLRWPIIETLTQRGRHDQAARLEQGHARVERRIRAYRETSERLLPRPATPATEASRFVFDQYSANPFLLYLGSAREGELGAAIQVDQALLLWDFLVTVRRHRDVLVVTDAAGNWVAGQRVGGPVTISVAFSRTLTHLRVGIRQEAVDERMAGLGDQWWVPMVVVLMASVLALFTLVIIVRTFRQQNELLARQREFTARVTHELKTPLAGIRVMAENLETGTWRDDDQQRDMARSIVTEADRLGRRVDEILSVARQRALPAPEPFDPEEVALEVIDQWGPRLERAGVRLHADLHPSDEVVGDAAAVRDSLGALLDNALKYRDESRPDPQVWMTLSQDGGYVVFDIADNGIGVPPDRRRDIFERFVRIEGPNRGKAGGHGLGLSQVAQTARRHRGSVECLEADEGGARFVLRLPAAR